MSKTKTKTKQNKTKQKKKSSPHFVIFSPAIFLLFFSVFTPFSFFLAFFFPFVNFPFLLLHFPYFLCLSFPIRRQKFPNQKSLGFTLPCPPPPPACYATELRCCWMMRGKASEKLPDSLGFIPQQFADGGTDQ